MLVWYIPVGYMEEHGVDSINLDDISKGREKRETYHWFLDQIASVVVGISVFEKVKCIQPPSEWLTPSLEGFCLLCIENYLEKIKSTVRKENTTAKALWTADGRGSRKNRGWNQEGIRRYNILVDRVRTNRDKFPREDVIYLHAKQEERRKFENERLKRRQEEESNKEKGLEAAYDDFSSSDSDAD